MNKKELTEQIARTAGLSKESTSDAMKAILEIIADALAQGDKVCIRGFGTFEVRPRAARMAKEPHTGRSIRIPESNVPFFVPSRTLKATVKK